MRNHVAQSEKRAGLGPEELIKLLVGQVAKNNGFPTNPESKGQAEEIIMDTEVDGARYLLVRLPKSNHAHMLLSPREQEIVRMVAKGYANKVIGGVLNISSWTVGTHLRRIFAKLGVGSRAAMVARMLEEGRVWDQLQPGKPPLSRAVDTSTMTSPLPANASVSRRSIPAYGPESSSRRIG